MTFDPDKFLTQKDQFDPDEFLGTTIEPEIPQPKIIEEMHPAVSWKDRALVKNFGGQDGGVNFLRQKYPNLQVEMSPKGRVMMKGKNEQEWRVLDPDAEGFDGLQELAMDIGDIGYDVAASGIEAAATGLAGLGGGLATGGVGAIPSAMAGGAAAGATMEGLRQSIGKGLGVTEEYDPEMLKFAAGAGAISPILFGTGGTAKGLANMVKKRGLDISEEAAEKILKSQRGGIKRGYDAFKDSVPFLADVTSGIKGRNYKNYIDNLDEMKEWGKEPHKFTDFVTTTGKEIDKAAENRVKQAGDEMGKILDKYVPDMEVDLDPFYRELKQEANMMRMSDDLDVVALADKFDDQIERMFTNAQTGEITTKFNFEKAKTMRDKFTRLNKRFRANLTGDPIRDTMVELGDRGYMKVQEAIDNSLDLIEEGAGEAFKESRARYRQALALKNKLDSSLFTVDKQTGLKDYSKTLNTLKNMENDNKVMLMEEIRQVLPEVSHKSDRVEAFLNLNKPSLYPTTGTATSTTRTITMATLGTAIGSMSGEGGMGGGTGAAIGIGVGLLGLSPAAWRAYMKAGKAGENALKNAFRAAGKVPPENLKKYFNAQAHGNVWKHMVIGKQRQEQDR